MTFITLTFKKYGAKLLFSDTDSLVYEIKKKMIFRKIFIKIRIFFYFSDYPQGSKFFDLVNKKVIGKMKDVFKRKIISEFVGLNSKMYSLIDVDNEESKKANGVNKMLLKK